jgi:hypothetical protein
MHPIGERGDGWEQVRVSDQAIRVGTDLAYEVGIKEGRNTLAGERISIKRRLTNIYRRKGREPQGNR